MEPKEDKTIGEESNATIDQLVAEQVKNLEGIIDKLKGIAAKSRVDSHTKPNP